MILTAQQHLQREQEKLTATGARVGCVPYALMDGITIAVKIIASKIRTAGLSGIYGSCGDTNLHSEEQQKLDVYANDALSYCLGLSDSVASFVSEENDNPVIYVRNAKRRRYVIVVDPLDGSSNIDANAAVGTIFSILHRDPDDVSAQLESACQPWYRQVIAGYVVCGPSAVLVYTAGNGVSEFRLDNALGDFTLSQEHLRMPLKGASYSANEANSAKWPAEYRAYLHDLRAGKLGRRYGSRYIGSLVADFHRICLKGGVFLYPQTSEQPDGKLRLLYEANPLAFIAEQAGGVTAPSARRVLEN